MRRTFQAARGSIEQYPANSYNQGQLKGLPGESVPHLHVGSNPVHITDPLHGNVAKFHKSITFGSNAHYLKGEPGFHVPYLTPPSHNHSNLTLNLALSREKEGKPVDVKTIDPAEHKSIMNRIHNQLQNEYGAHFANAVNSQNKGVIHSMIESNAAIMAFKGKISTDEAASYLARVPADSAVSLPPLAPPPPVGRAPAPAPRPVGRAAAPAPASRPIMAGPAPALSHPPGGPPGGPILEEKKDSSVTKPSHAALIDMALLKRKGEPGYFKIKQLNEFLRSFGMALGKKTRKSKLERLIRGSSDFREKLAASMRKSDMSGSGRMSDKKEGLSSGMFDATHAKLLAPVPSSYRHQLS
jgi:hypothetical protein